jgi:hypothetical protein
MLHVCCCARAPQVKSFFGYFDGNADGKISWDEFRSGLGGVSEAMLTTTRIAAAPCAGAAHLRKGVPAVIRDPAAAPMSFSESKVCCDLLAVQSSAGWVLVGRGRGGGGACHCPQLSRQPLCCETLLFRMLSFVLRGCTVVCTCCCCCCV